MYVTIINYKLLVIEYFSHKTSEKTCSLSQTVNNNSDCNEYYTNANKVNYT